MEAVDQRGQLGQRVEHPRAQHRNADDRQPGQQFGPPRGTEEGPVVPVQHVELAEVVRQRVVEDGVLGVAPFAVQHVPVGQHRPQPRGEAGGPRLQRSELALARAAAQVVPARLQPQFAVGGEADPRVGPVELLLGHHGAPAQLPRTAPGPGPRRPAADGSRARCGVRGYLTTAASCTRPTTPSASRYQRPGQCAGRVRVAGRRLRASPLAASSWAWVRNRRRAGRRRGGRRRAGPRR